MVSLRGIASAHVSGGGRRTDPGEDQEEVSDVLTRCWRRGDAGGARGRAITTGVYQLVWGRIPDDVSLFYGRNLAYIPHTTRGEDSTSSRPRSGLVELFVVKSGSTMGRLHDRDTESHESA